MYCDVDLGKLYYSKLVVDSFLVEEVDLVDDQPLDEVTKTTMPPKEVLLTYEVPGNFFAFVFIWILLSNIAIIIRDL